MHRSQTFDYPMDEMPKIVATILELDEWHLDTDGHHWIKWMKEEGGEHFRVCLDITSDEVEARYNTMLAIFESAKNYLRYKNVYYHDSLLELSDRTQEVLSICMACILDNKEDCRVDYDPEKQLWTWTKLK